MKKKYLSPELEWLRFDLIDAILASSQYENQQIDIGDLDPTEDDLDPDDPNGFGP